MASALKPPLSIRDRPKPQEPAPELRYGSDAIAQQLSQLDIDYISLVPGSSYRGLHDSLINLNGNTKPEMLVTLHEEHAVAIAHGYFKVTSKPMAVAVHANVGLMHASMAIYNAFCDRVGMVVLGATGPVDADRRRPWIDWIHTAQDQGALVRGFVKWDDQPGGVQAAVEALGQAYVKAKMKPCGPTYVCLDLGLQEDEIQGREGRKNVELLDISRYLDAAMHPPGPSADVILRVESALSVSKKPLFLFGRMSGHKADWQKRIQLVEKFDARVVTDLKLAATFPTAHRCQPSPPGVFISPQTSQMMREADVIIAFDWVDLAGNLKAAGAMLEGCKVVNVSLDSALHNGWSKDHFALPPADIFVHADVDKTVAALLVATHAVQERKSHWSETTSNAGDAATVSQYTKDIFMPDLARALYAVVPPDDICLVRVPLGWSGKDLQVTHPLGFMGMDGGAGIGSGPGQVVGTALGLNSLPDDSPNKKLLTVAVLGDGDFLMGNSALWTAAKYRLPLLIIVANNASYFNDEVHQERVAKHRGRLVENKWIGMKLDDPTPDLHKIAEGLGCTVVRPEQVRDLAQLEGAIVDAVKEVKAGKPVVLDVRVLPEGYSSAMSEKAK